MCVVLVGSIGVDKLHDRYSDDEALLLCILVKVHSAYHLACLA